MKIIFLIKILHIFKPIIVDELFKNFKTNFSFKSELPPKNRNKTMLKSIKIEAKTIKNGMKNVGKVFLKKLKNFLTLNYL